MTPRPPRPRADLPRIPFLVRDAVANGVPPGALRSKALHTPVPGVRMDAALADDFIAVCRAVALLLPDGAAFSHLTAARLWKLPLSAAAEQDPRLHVTTTGANRVLRTARIVPHRGLGPGDSTRTEGVPVTTPGRVWRELGTVDLASDHRPVAGVDPAHEELVVLTDALLSCYPLTDLPRYGLLPRDLVSIVRSLSGERGVGRLRCALAEASTFVDSSMETRTRLRAIASGFPRPVVGADLVGPDGAWIARPDLCWPQVRVAIEYDGASHVSRSRLGSDVARREAMERYGWRSVVLYATDVGGRWWVTCERLREAFALQGCADPARIPPAPRALERPRIVAVPL
ncbi:hypothetical protein GCM10023221_13460 [Luteimicrobium xylanilyticum]|uniref:hypothetical protein n=1 Tax=Luteimicrobium xylanilyticum TaxID=1133546 RepID=UPI0004AE4E43|nr:hypothetical protein [Luteimicrobium xylanilyticum]